MSGQSWLGTNSANPIALEHNRLPPFHQSSGPSRPIPTTPSSPLRPGLILFVLQTSFSLNPLLSHVHRAAVFNPLPPSIRTHRLYSAYPGSYPPIPCVLRAISQSQPGFWIVASEAHMGCRRAMGYYRGECSGYGVIRVNTAVGTTTRPGIVVSGMALQFGIGFGVANEGPAMAVLCCACAARGRVLSGGVCPRWSGKAFCARNRGELCCFIMFITIKEMLFLSMSQS